MIYFVLLGSIALIFGVMKFTGLCAIQAARREPVGVMFSSVFWRWMVLSMGVVIASTLGWIYICLWLLSNS